MIAAGFGCRRGCSVADIVSALHAALASAERELSHVVALGVPDFKRAEAAFVEAAQRLGKPLLWISEDALVENAALTISRSPRALERFGLPAIAETAALACDSQLGGQAAVQLLGPRVSSGHATCALASAAGDEP